MEPELFDGAVLLGDTCVVADVHLGLEDSLRGTGLNFPLNEGDRLRQRLEGVMDRFEPGRFVLNGDILHEFGRIPRGLDERLDELLELLESRVDEVVLIEGKHDRMLETVTDREVLREYRVDGALVLHGDAEPGDLSDGQDSLRDAGSPGLYVIGHEHPAIEIEGEKRCCYLLGEARGAEVLVLPAFNELSRGVTVNRMGREDFMSPLLRDAANLRPLVEAGDEVLEFPPMGEIRRFL